MVWLTLSAAVMIGVEVHLQHGAETVSTVMEISARLFCFSLLSESTR